MLYKHLPFFEKKCTNCHLASSQEMNSPSFAEQVFFTGSDVPQQPMFRKKIIAESSTEYTIDHMVTLDGLEFNKKYRFRLVFEEMNGAPDSGKIFGDWLGLLPREVPEAGAEQPSFTPTGLVQGLPRGVSSFSFSRIEDTIIFASWLTVNMSKGWIELEELEWVGAEINPSLPSTPPFQTANISHDMHPQLREVEDANIDHCYSCHPHNDLGVSHPVRVYATKRGISIPPDLPTINGGMMTCVTCHVPHGAPGKQLIREMVKTKLCVACHTEFKGRSRATMF